jgi:hypothetical protein
MYKFIQAPDLITFRLTNPIIQSLAPYQLNMYVFSWPFNDAVSIETMQRQITEWLTNWKGFARKGLCLAKMLCRLLRVGTKGFRRNVGHNSRCPSRYSKRALPKYEPRVLPLNQPVRSHAIKSVLHFGLQLSWSSFLVLNVSRFMDGWRDSLSLSLTHTHTHTHETIHHNC